MLVASLFLTAHEILLTVVQDRIKGFLCTESTIKNGEIVYKYSKLFETEVLNRDIPFLDKKNRGYHLWYSSLLWLADNEVITPDEVHELEAVRCQRNDIAHKLKSLLLDDSISINTGLLIKLKQLVQKIERWWVINVEIPINPEFDGQTIDEENIKSGNMILLDYLIEIVLS